MGPVIGELPFLDPPPARIMQPLIKFIQGRLHFLSECSIRLAGDGGSSQSGVKDLMDFLLVMRAAKSRGPMLRTIARVHHEGPIICEDVILELRQPELSDTFE